MLFRIQNLYITLALVCIVVVISSSIGGYDWKYEFNGDKVHFEAVIDSFGVYFSKGGDENLESRAIPFYLGFIFLAMISAAALLSFKNRKRQLTINRINFTLHLIMVLVMVTGLIMGDSFGVEYLMKGENGAEVDIILEKYPIVTQYGIGFFAAITSVPLLFMANFGIKRDEQLVKSLDRIR